MGSELNARALLQAKLPFVLQHMTDGQLQQMQRVLDAAVINPKIQREAKELYDRSIRAKSGRLSVQNAELVAAAERKEKQLIRVTDMDRRILLDFRKLLAPDALIPKTDNPDELKYLQQIAKTLSARGVWLRFAPQIIPDSQDPSRYVLGGQTFTVWLSLGPDGDTIPTDTGYLDRKALLGTTAIGAGYYSHVYKGPVMSALEGQIRLLQYQIETGVSEHDLLEQRYREAFFGVAEISDFIGGADLPGRKIWDQPYRLLSRARQQKLDGDLEGTATYLVAAAVSTRVALQLLDSYAKASMAGAERVGKVLTAIETAGKIAEFGLTIIDGIAIVRGGIRFVREVRAMQRGELWGVVPGVTGARAAAAESVDVAGERAVRDYAARNMATAGDVARFRYVPIRLLADDMYEAVIAVRLGKGASVPANVEKNVKELINFVVRNFNKRGKGSPTVMRELVVKASSGIDLHSPVTVIKFSKGTKVAAYADTLSKPNIVGNLKGGEWLTKAQGAVGPDGSGIAAAGRLRVTGVVTKDIEVLQSTNAAVDDFWTTLVDLGIAEGVQKKAAKISLDKAREYYEEAAVFKMINVMPTRGGGIQYLFPEPWVGEFIRWDPLVTAVKPPVK